MKFIAHVSRWLGILALASAILIGCTSSGAIREGNPPPSNRGKITDYGIDDLDAYGMWITLPPYGSVWRPNVTEGWAPFYYGHWDYTPPTWTWVSYEPFGWIVYHYGNWLYTPGYSWVWIPGNGVWSPATVQWMNFDDVVGWAPLPPRGVVLPPPWERFENIDVWNIVRARDFTSDNVGDFGMRGELARPREPHAQVNNRVPDPRMIERYSGRPVSTVRIDRDPVKVGKQQLHKMRMPPADQQRAEQHKGEVEKHVTRSTENGRSTGNHR